MKKKLILTVAILVSLCFIFLVSSLGTSARIPDNARRGLVFTPISLIFLPQIFSEPLPTATTIPTKTPTATLTTTPTPTPTPTQSIPPTFFTLVEQHLWTVEENGGSVIDGSVHCGTGHTLFVVALDNQGNLLDGVTVGSIYVPTEEKITGSSGHGTAEFILFPPGMGIKINRDVNGQEVDSDDFTAWTEPSHISFEQLIDAYYCENEADCTKFVSQRGCYGHYSWTVTFMRNG